jgi:hypothetical protein
MRTNEFTLLLAGINEVTDSAANALYEAGCDDGSFASRNGVAFIMFHRKAENLREAIDSAIADVKQAGCEVAQVEMEESQVVAEVNSGLPRSSLVNHVVAPSNGASRKNGIKPPPKQGSGGSIRYSELPEVDPNRVLGREMNVYRKEVGRLLEEGNEEKFVLIKGDEIFGIFDTLDDAVDAGSNRFLGQPYLAKQILAEEPVYRIRG